MFDKYVILEQNLDSVKLKHIKTGDVSWRYRAACTNCGKDRGWKKAYKVNGLCKGCSQHANFIANVDKSKYANVVFHDFKVLKRKGKIGFRYVYKTTCLACDKDRGHIDLADSDKLCRSCIRKHIHSTKSHSDKQKIAQKISMAQSGDIEFSGFYTSDNNKQRDLFKSLGLSKQAFERDSYTCQKCSISGVELHAHHKNGFRRFPEQRFELSNLITLCKGCHTLFHRIFGRKDNTEEQILEFLSNPQR